MLKNKKTKDIIVIGMALFSMYFGAGNLIFPPLLGQSTGGAWWLGFLFFFLFDMGLAIIAILAVIHKNEESIDGITGVMGKIPSTVINCAIILCLGPLLAIPRTAATTFEISVAPVCEWCSSWLFSAIFFVLVILLTLKPSKVMDIIGNYLTPALFIGLVILIIQGMIHPIGSISSGELGMAVKEGTLSGYQTLDPLGSMIFVMLIVGNARSKGYEGKENLSAITIKSSLIAAALLFAVYGGLTYLGATTMTKSAFAGLSQTELIIKIVLTHFGNFGMAFLGVIVLLACLTTAIGLTSAMGAFFEDLTKGKVKYEWIVILTCLFSYFTSNLGVSAIIKFSAPVLFILYPGILILVILAFFHTRIKNLNVYRLPVLVAMAVSLMEVSGVEFIKLLPLAQVGFSWIIPAIIAGFVGILIPDFRKGE